jgi:hypothetical protein
MPGDERSLGADVTVAGVPPALERGTLTILGLLPNSSNYTFLAEATEGETRTLAVYKPCRGESPLWDFPDGSLAAREVAASEVAAALGWPPVPTTVFRDGPEGPGSVQAFVPFEPQEHFFTLERRFPEAFRAIATFDLVANNADRKGGHCLLGEDGRVWAIDHGLCFHVEPKLRTVIWGFADEPIPGELVDGVAALGRALDAGDPALDRLRSLLSADEVTALRRRIASLVADPVFPLPRGERPYPWPPV